MNASSVLKMYAWLAVSLLSNIVHASPTERAEELVTRAVAPSPVTLKCNMFAPNTKIKWLKEGLEVEGCRFQVQDNGDLKIDPVHPQDKGQYTCYASYESDNMSASTRLEVESTPSPPKVPGVLCDGLMGGVRYESAGDGGAPILGYTIQYNTSFTPDQWVDAYVDVSPNDTMVMMLLSPWGNYSFRAIARNKNGLSEPTVYPYVCKTPSHIPHKNPDNVIGKGTGKDNLIISWTAMPLIDQNAPGFFYRIFFKREDVPNAPWHQIDWDQGNHIAIVNLPTFTAYRIKVEAHNSEGQAEDRAEEVIGYSGEDVPLKEPKNFRLVSISPEDPKLATLAWDPVPPESLRGHFKGYKIQIWTRYDGEEDMRELVVAPNATKAVVTLFKPSARNIAQVLAFNGMHDGPASERIYLITPDGTQEDAITTQEDAVTAQEA